MSPRARIGLIKGRNPQAYRPAARLNNFDVRFTPKGDQITAPQQVTLWARSDQSALQQKRDRFDTSSTSMQGVNTTPRIQTQALKSLGISAPALA
jgi:hypothetical protein